MKWIYTAILFWLLFVLSLAGWWFYYGISIWPSTPAELNPSQMVRHQRMFFMEGFVLMVSLLSGGLALLYFAYRTYKEKAAKEIFFASFTHDLKTALFRLQLEIEKLGKKTDEPELEKILAHSRKMTLDLENSLDSTFGYNRRVFLETIDLKNFLVELHTQWPEFHIKFSGDAELRSDRKAMHSIFKNLLQNSFIHGEADEVDVRMSKQNGKYHLYYKDNGKSFEGDIESLGVLSRQSNLGSSSGFGLYIVKQWVDVLKGQVQFSAEASSGLQIRIELPQGKIL